MSAARTNNGGRSELGRLSGLMKRLSSISIYREDQPSVPTWDRLHTFAAEWSRSHEPQMRLIFGELLHVANIDIAQHMPSFATMPA